MCWCVEIVCSVYMVMTVLVCGECVVYIVMTVLMCEESVVYTVMTVLVYLSLSCT